MFFFPDFMSGTDEGIAPYYRLVLLLFITLLSFVVFYAYKKNTFEWYNDELISPQWNDENTEYCFKALESITDGKAREALSYLSSIKDQVLHEEIINISSRLAKFEKENRLGLLSYEQRNTTSNNINHAIIKIINNIRSNLQRGGEIYKKIKENLRERYQAQLNQKLSNRQSIKIRRIFSDIGTSEITREAFVKISPTAIQKEIGSVFEESFGRLLIVGNPGVGKSCLLLELELQLLDSDRLAVPVILNLSTWSERYVTLENWLEIILPIELGVNKTFTRKILEQARLILLFDGFDEIAQTDRKSFLEAIGQYGSNPKHQYVITSRIEEYNAVAKDAPVNLQLEIGPLSYEQVLIELDKMGYNQPGAKPLLIAISNSKALQKIIESPFYFNLLQSIFSKGDRLTDSLNEKEKTEKVKLEIIERFISLELSVKKGNWNKAKCFKWLSFLAHEMNSHNIFDLQLSDLQYSWGNWKYRYIFLGGLVRAIFVKGLKYGVVLALSLNSVRILMYGLEEIDSILMYSILSFSIGIIVAIYLEFAVDGIENMLIQFLSFISLVFQAIFSRKEHDLSPGEPPRIEVVDRLVWSYTSFIDSIKSFLFGFLLTGLFYGISNLSEYLLKENNPEEVMIFEEFLFFGLVIGIGRSIYLLFTKNQSQFIKLKGPYQRFRSSSWAMHFSILQHLLIRYQLFIRGFLPFRLVTFLNFMKSRNLLESDGATWRFRHRLIQDYFADHWEKR